MLIRSMRYNPLHMADYNTKSHDTEVLPDYLREKNLNFTTLAYVYDGNLFSTCAV